MDLAFSTSGLRRLGQVGRTQKSIDLEISLPSTGERAFVELKSHATASTLADYTGRLAATAAYYRMFLVWHTGDLEEDNRPLSVVLLRPKKLSLGP